MTATAMKLPLHDAHAEKGARFMEFAGWTVPLTFRTITEEHNSVRNAVGVFDVSHMGKFTFKGPVAYSFLDQMLSNGLHKIAPGRALYSLLLNQRGGVVDDVIVYQHSRDHFFMIVNAATMEKDWKWFQDHSWDELQMQNESREKTILAVQGPKSVDVLKALFGEAAASIKPFHFTTVEAFGTQVFIGATGYTGECGFELITENAKTTELFKALFEAGEPFGIEPIGFGARDTLRLEAKYSLYGQDMDDETTALEASLEWVCDFSKDFFGKDALLAQKERGLERKLVGFELTQPGIARHDCEAVVNGEVVGKVTSGTFCPTVNKAIGLVYLPVEHTAVGSQFAVTVRGREIAARVVKTPFYKKP